MLDPKTSDAYYHSADDDGNSRKSTSFHQGIRMSVRFGAYIMDVSARRLRRGSADVHLSPKAFDLLSLLIARRPSVVEKADLRRALWRDVHVVEATLGNLVAEIRAALDEGSTDPSHIRTVHAARNRKSSRVIGHGGKCVSPVHAGPGDLGQTHGHRRAAAPRDRIAGRAACR